MEIHGLGEVSMHVTARTTLVVLVLALGGLMVPPASAEVDRIWDRRNDGSNGAGGGGPHKWGDIRKVRIGHADRQVWVKASPPVGGMAADEYFFWIDVAGTDRGPDFVAWLTFVTGPRVSLHRSDGFGDLGRKRCGLRRPRLDVYRQSVQFGIPRRCLRPAGVERPPRRVRLGVETWMEYEPADWAPRRRGLGPWVAAG
jgi:hypothetical protein